MILSLQSVECARRDHVQAPRADLGGRRAHNVPNMQSCACNLLHAVQNEKLINRCDKA
jgi:hypothetical protein